MLLSMFRWFTLELLIKAKLLQYGMVEKVLGG
jgi:hypothetical protein